MTKQEVFDILDPIIDDIITMIVEGETQRSICNKFGVKLTAFQTFLTDNHSARAKEAYRLSAISKEEGAMDVLINAPSDSIEIARAREIASHMRWQAKMRDRAKYGDSVQVSGDQDAPIRTVNEHRYILQDMSDGSEKPL